MKIKLIILAIVCLILVSACSVDNSGNNNSVYRETPTCKEICDSHKFTYYKEKEVLSANDICYCVDEDGGVIWTFTM